MKPSYFPYDQPDYDHRLDKTFNQPKKNNMNTETKQPEAKTAEEVLKKRVITFPSDEYMASNDIMRNVIAAMEEYASQFKQEWISVEKELPELLEYVLVYNTEGATLVARRFIDAWVAFFADGEKPMGELKPTHWMPLPQKPKS